MGTMSTARGSRNVNCRLAEVEGGEQPGNTPQSGGFPATPTTTGEREPRLLDAKNRSPGCERLPMDLFRGRWRKHFRSTGRLRLGLGFRRFLGFLPTFIFVSHASKCATSQGSVNRGRIIVNGCGSEEVNE